MLKSLSRRTALKVGLLGSASLLASGLGCQRWYVQTQPLLIDEPFQQPLPIPPVLEPVRRDATTDYYELTLMRSHLTYAKPHSTELWTYNGAVPGPIIRQVGGPDPALRRQSVVRVTNHLDHDKQGRPIQTVLHLHGMGSLPQYDGYTTDYIDPDQFKDYHYPNDRAGTLWYHDHTMDLTARNINMGLAGFYLVDDPHEAALNLPQGDYDIPLLIQRKQFGHQGEFILNRAKNDPTFAGEYTLVNGMPLPYCSVARRAYRFRLLNGSPVRHFQVALSRSPERLTEGEAFVVIGSDGGLLAEPVTLDNTAREPLPLGIGERYDVVIDFSRYAPGDQVYLHRVLPNVNVGGRVEANASFQRIMRFDLDPSAPSDPSLDPSLDPINNELPSQLRTIEPLVTPANRQDLTQRTFVFDREQRGDRRWTINQKVFDPGRIDAEPDSGSVEIWTFVNAKDDVVHPIHVHLAEGQLLERNGRRPRPYEQGWKDVFVLGENETLRVALRFDSHALDNISGLFMMHCHQMVHEDRGMMGQFEVIL